VLKTGSSARGTCPSAGPEPEESESAEPAVGCAAQPGSDRASGRAATLLICGQARARRADPEFAASPPRASQPQAEPQTEPDLGRGFLYAVKMPWVFGAARAGCGAAAVLLPGSSSLPVLQAASPPQRCPDMDFLSKHMWVSADAVVSCRAPGTLGIPPGRSRDGDGDLLLLWGPAPAALGLPLGGTGDGL